LLGRRPVVVDSRVNVITGQIIGAAIEVHRTLGPGLLHSTYMPCLQFELATGKLRFVAERAVPVLYKGMELDANARLRAGSAPRSAATPVMAGPIGPAHGSSAAPITSRLGL
jgi:hypothetical protein